MAIFRKSELKKKEVQSVTAGRPAAGTKPLNSASFLIKQVWLSERAGHMAKDRKYVFVVDSKANKSEVKKAVETRYKVKVQDVNMINMKGKSKRLGQSVGRTPSFKKAIVTLMEGQKIEIV